MDIRYTCTSMHHAIIISLGEVPGCSVKMEKIHIKIHIDL